MGREATPVTGAAVAPEEAAASGWLPTFTVSDVTVAPRTAAGTVVDTAADNAPELAVNLLARPSGAALMSGTLVVVAAATLAEALAATVEAGEADGLASEISFAAEATEVAGALAEEAAVGTLADCALATGVWARRSSALTCCAVFEICTC